MYTFQYRVCPPDAIRETQNSVLINRKVQVIRTLYEEDNKKERKQGKMNKVILSLIDRNTSSYF
jgi:hypothetical protein